MTLDEIRRLYRYSRWATERLLGAARDLDPSALDTPLGTSFGTLRGTIAHLYGVERMWLDRWHGEAPSAPAALPVEPVTATEARWRDVWNGQDAFLAARSAKDLAGAFAYRNQRGQPASVGLQDMLLHLVNHGTYHRGQIAAALRQLGGTPLPTDYLLFATDRP